jgi:hypothetical protein
VPVAGYDAVVADSKGVVAQRFGLKNGGRVVIRTLIFQGRPNTEVHLLEGTGHCAMSKAPEVVPKIIAWLAGQFA